MEQRWWPPPRHYRKNVTEDDSLDFVDGSPEAERLDRLLETILWMAWPQRPGMLGVPQALLGTLPNGDEAEFRKTADGSWSFVVPASNRDEPVEPSKVVELMGEADFLPDRVVVVPEIAHHLFLAAIIETEQAQASWRKALQEVLRSLPNARRFFKDAKYFDALMADARDPMGFIMAGDAMDECVRHAVTAIPLAVGAADAQVNTWANSHGGWSDAEQRKGLARRYQLLAERKGTALQLEGEPLLSLRGRVKLRNDLIHGNAVAQEQPLEQKVAGRPLVLEARQTCFVVRTSLLDLASILDEPPPRYLAFCPEGSIEDDDMWGSARVMTGLREDSVFPKVGA